MRWSVWPSNQWGWDDILGVAQHAEATGWDGVWFADHFMPNTGDATPADGAAYECWSVLSALAATVPRVRLGSLVAGITYRHPAVLAKIACTIDQVSGGRLVLGVGAGWQQDEHEAYGIELGSIRTRLDRFEEACEVLAGLLSEQRTTIAGKFFTITDAPCDPKPAQSPMPLLIGGSGEKRTLRIAARLADEWNAWGTPELFAHKSAVLDAHAADLGRDPATIVRSTQAIVQITDGAASEPGRTLPAMLRGTTEELTTQFGAYAEAGLDEFIVPLFTSPPRARDLMDQLKAEVIPQIA